MHHRLYAMPATSFNVLLMSIFITQKVANMIIRSANQTMRSKLKPSLTVTVTTCYMSNMLSTIMSQSVGEKRYVVLIIGVP